MPTVNVGYLTLWRGGWRRERVSWTWYAPGVSNPNAPASWGLSDAVAAGVAVPDYVEVPYEPDDVVLTTLRDALKMPFPQAGGRVMRAPCSYREQIQVARSLGCCSATIEWAKAIWRAAPFKQNPIELVVTDADAEQMGTLEWLVRREDRLDAQMAAAPPGAWGRGALKGWYVDPMMMEQGPLGACNWGFVRPSGVADQSPGGRHDWNQIDYSQVEEDLVLRWARRLSDGSPVDLVELQCRKFPALAARLRAEYGPATIPSA